MPEVSVGTWADLLQTRHNNFATRHRDWLANPSNSSPKNYNMADNKKQEKDFTKEVDALLPDADATIKVRFCSLLGLLDLTVGNIVR